MRADRILCTLAKPVMTIKLNLLIDVATYYRHAPNVTTNRTHSHFSWPKLASNQLTFLSYSTTEVAIRASQTALITSFMYAKYLTLVIFSMTKAIFGS